MPLLASGFFVLATLPTGAVGGGGALDGSWQGSGWVSFSSGKKERARCRVHFSAQSPRAYSVSATCATESGKVSQTATVRRAGANAYVGSFYNSEFDVSGTIRINGHTARLTSGSGSALITLSR